MGMIMKTALEGFGRGSSSRLSQDIVTVEADIICHIVLAATVGKRVSCGAIQLHMFRGEEIRVRKEPFIFSYAFCPSI